MMEKMDSFIWMGSERTSFQTYRQKSRRNGWQCPLHPLQFVAWFGLIYFSTIYFSTLVPALPSSWHPAGYIINGIVLFSHCLTHFIACQINPADPAVIKKKKQGRMPTFDSNQHRHVIENQHCYLCEVSVGPKSKHCSACNKCVSDFDHHCKWLNNCVGGKNYRWFIGTLLTAIIGSLITFIISLAEFIAYFTDETNGNILNPYIEYFERVENEGSNATVTPVFHIFHQEVLEEGWLILVSITGLLAVITSALIIHLFTFHMYLLFKGISTYDFIVMQREKEDLPDYNDDTSSISSWKRKSKKKNVGAAHRSSARSNKIQPSEGQTEITASPKSIKNAAEIEEQEKRAAEMEKLEEGETPPPSASPIHSVTDNKTVSSLDDRTTLVKKLKKKKKRNSARSTHSSGSYYVGDKDDGIATIDTPKLYMTRGYAAQMEMSLTPVMIKAPPPVGVKSVGPAPDYHSDSAESLSEVVDKKSNTLPHIPEKRSVPNELSQTVPASNRSSDKKKRKKKKKELIEGHVDENLNSTTLFVPNENAKYHFDGSLTYPERGKNELPLTPILLKRGLPEDVPVLDFSGLRTSSDSSLSYRPMSTMRSSTDTTYSVHFQDRPPRKYPERIPEGDTEV